MDSSRALTLPGVLAVLTGADAHAAGLGRDPARPRPSPAAAASRSPRRPFPRSRSIASATWARRWRSRSPRRPSRRPTPPHAVVVDLDPLPGGRRRGARAGPRRARDLAGRAGQRGLRLGGRRRRRGGGGDARARRTWRGSGCTTRASPRPRWSRAPPSVSGTRPTGATPSSPAPRASRSSAASSRRACSRSRVQQLRVITPDVGGGFGMKVQAYPEYAALLFAARRVGRAGEVARHARGELPGRHRRPRRHARGRAGPRRGRALPRPPHAHPRGPRRLRHRVRGGVRHQQHQELPVERLPHPGHRHRRDPRVHQRGAARALSRRGAARGALRDRAPDRPGRGRARPRPRRAAAPQPDPARGHALPHAQRADLRQRGVRDRDGSGARAGRLEGLSGAPRRLRAGRAPPRHRARLLPRGGGRHPGRDGGPALRRRRHRRAPHRGPADGPGPPLDLSPADRGAARHRSGRGTSRPGRQRPGPGRHPERGVALDDDGGQRGRARVRRRGRQRAPRRGALLRGGGPRRRVRVRTLPRPGHRPRDRPARPGRPRPRAARVCPRTSPTASTPPPSSSRPR